MRELTSATDGFYCILDGLSLLSALRPTPEAQNCGFRIYSDSEAISNARTLIRGRICTGGLKAGPCKLFARQRSLAQYSKIECALGLKEKYILIPIVHASLSDTELLSTRQQPLLTGRDKVLVICTCILSVSELKSSKR
ncbi:uncharacterized protein EKO05_0005704 [Ascochyta rabiei]|uniref:uncharacterized protein n=1 Tax=Didymella rabiei TaxID=5454 RepID=UPI0021FEE9FA|nr:uncharacterized protein EKO05_0005704 [Ascochyta rabiei]UPX15249.1 hypothetical protein EKO05_0005704 [Ascochyta rabiei]